MHLAWFCDSLVDLVHAWGDQNDRFGELFSAGQTFFGGIKKVVWTCYLLQMSTFDFAALPAAKSFLTARQET